MVPIRLELNNFMSYGEDTPPLEFAGMHMVCLSGENGHGKSALLDAITWSLWGVSRAGKNKHPDLVRIGSDKDMSVQFTFEIDAQIYKVIRKHSKKTSGSIWELQQDNGDGGWRSLTGNNSGETEKAIQKLLRMSYETFSNSAYLRQGQADQFVQQTPGKRKEILADILDLSRYDQLESKARERMKAAEADAVELERDINGIDAELRSEDEHRGRMAELQTRREELQARRGELQTEFNALRDRKGQLDGQKQFADQLTQQIAGLTVEIGELTDELRTHQTDAERCRLLLARQDEIARNYERLMTLRGQMQTLERDLEQFHRGQQVLAATEKEWMAAENEVQRRIERATAEHEQALGRLQDYPVLQQEFDAISPRVAAADASEELRGTMQQTVVTTQERFSKLREENARLESQIEQWQKRIQKLTGQQGVCDVCNSPLPSEKIASTRAEYEETLTTLRQKQKQVRADASQVKGEMTTLQQQLDALDTKARAATQSRVRLGQIQQRLLELEAVQKSLPNLAAIRTEAEQVWQQGKFAPETKAKLDKYGRALEKLATVETDYAAVKLELTSLAQTEREQIALEHARTALTTAEAGMARVQKSLRLRHESRETLAKQLASLADVSGELIILESRIAEIGALERSRHSEEQMVSQEIGRREHALARLEELNLIRADKDARWTKARKAQEIHERLTQAFGKKGVQALIIENAIPELQEEANRLLERLTDGDMSLYFDTLREAKSKRDSPIETLDIKVSDNLGTRPLEMYSGGEGFRAAFALRIALSKLLARRAGARLQTLIIDEGFGTQDSKGREKLVDALNAIKDDFQRIIVITHIDELKDAFATRIEVTKTPSGSQITVMEGAAG